MPDHAANLEDLRAFVTESVAPHAATWDDAGVVPREHVQPAGRTRDCSPRRSPTDAGGADRSPLDAARTSHRGRARLRCQRPRSSRLDTNLGAVQISTAGG